MAARPTVPAENPEIPGYHPQTLGWTPLWSDGGGSAAPTGLSHADISGGPREAGQTSARSVSHDCVAQDPKSGTGCGVIYTLSEAIHCLASGEGGEETSTFSSAPPVAEIPQPFILHALSNPVRHGLDQQPSPDHGGLEPALPWPTPPLLHNPPPISLNPATTVRRESSCDVKIGAWVEVGSVI